MRRIFASSMALALPLFLFGSLGPASNGAETRLGPATAHAIDLFGSDEADAEDEAWPGAFWRSESGIGKAKPAGIPTSFADLAERVAPAVVSIQTRETVRFDAFLTPGHPRGFGLPPMPGGPGEREFEQEGQGSGFVVSTDGYLVTNNHVAEAAEERVARDVGRVDAVRGEGRILDLLGEAESCIRGEALLGLVEALVTGAVDVHDKNGDGV